MLLLVIHQDNHLLMEYIVNLTLNKYYIHKHQEKQKYLK